jgi:SAM-dependent methyltransferase
MENPSDKTIETYRLHFNRYVERTPTEVSGELKEFLDDFISLLPAGGNILEIGSAQGRDARYFAQKGFKVVCTDVIPEALQKLSDEGFETAEFDFRDQPKSEWTNKFDGFFANAVLLHAPPEVLENALTNIATILKNEGVAAFSLKTGEGEEITTEKMDAPRYFHYHTEPEIRNVIKKLPFEIVSLAHNVEGKWLHVIMRKQIVPLLKNELELKE